MSEAPKKIWLHKGFWDSGDSSYWTDEENQKPESDKGNHYIRFDVVEQMREALVEVLAAERFSNKPPETVMQAEEKLDRIKQAVIKAEAVLKRLEE